MKRLSWVIVLALLAAVVPVHAFAQCCAKCPDAKMKELVGKALVLDLADKLELPADETATLLAEYGKYREELNALKTQRTETRDKLMAAVDGGGAEADISALTDKLMDLDKQIAMLKADTVDAYASDLTAAQMAACYTFLADLDQNICAAICALRGEGGPATCPAAAAPAAAESAAGAPAAAAATADPAAKALAAAKAFGEALKTQDMDKIMAPFADDFEHYEYGDKEGIKDFLSQAADMGYLEDLEVNLDDAEAEVDGDEVVVYPVEIMGAFGSVTLELVFKDKGGEMKITGMDASGI